MAKKRTITKRSSVRKSSRKTNRSIPVAKIAGGLAVLVLIVIGAGLVVELLIGPPSEQTGAAIRPIERFQVPPLQAPEKPPAPTVAKPMYEVFPKDHLPAPRPPAPLPQLPGYSPMVAIIIDDIGYDRHIADQFMALGVPLTLSLLPQCPHSRSIISQARAKGHEIMLHLPMEPMEYPAVNPGPGALLASMAPDELIAQLERNLDSLNGIKGVNNHMGSRISASPEQMRQIFSILKKRGLYYVDSRTTAETVALSSARLLQLPFAERDIFIDHLDDAAFIRSQMDRLVQRARKQGFAIGIAHPHDTTYQVLKEIMPRLKDQVALVPASMVVEQVMFAQAAAKTKAARQ